MSLTRESPDLAFQRSGPSSWSSGQISERGQATISFASSPRLVWKTALLPGLRGQTSKGSGLEKGSGHHFVRVVTASDLRTKVVGAQVAVRSARALRSWPNTTLASPIALPRSFRRSFRGLRSTRPGPDHCSSLGQGDPTDCSLGRAGQTTVLPDGRSSPADLKGTGQPLLRLRVFAACSDQLHDRRGAGASPRRSKQGLPSLRSALPRLLPPGWLPGRLRCSTWNTSGRPQPELDVPHGTLRGVRSLSSCDVPHGTLRGVRA
jgi:hypothetical protein